MGQNWARRRGSAAFPGLAFAAIAADLTALFDDLVLGLAIHPAEPAFRPGGEVGQRCGDLVAAPVAVVAALLKCAPGVWRAGAFVVAAERVVGAQAAFPIAVAAVLPALVGIDRVIAAAAVMVVEDRVEPDGAITRRVVVAEEVVAIRRPQEQVVGDEGDVDHRGGPVVEARGMEDRPGEIDRCEQDAAMNDHVVPVAGDEDVAARRPEVA